MLFMSLNFLAARLCRLMCGRSGPSEKRHLSVLGLCPKFSGAQPPVGFIVPLPVGRSRHRTSVGWAAKYPDVYGPQEARSGF